MSEEKITYSVHNYDPVNKYIDEKSRIKNAKSVWAYTKSLTLFLLALGLFTLLIAYAYHIYKDNRFYNLVEEGKEVNKSIDGEKVVYSQSVSRFDHSPPVGRFKITTGYRWNTVNDLRFGKPHEESWCYIRLMSGEQVDYYFDSNIQQSEKLKMMDLTESQVQSYKQYCSNQ